MVLVFDSLRIASEKSLAIGEPFCKNWVGRKISSLLDHYKKKSSYPNVFFFALLKTAVIEKPVPTLFEIASIGNPITAAQNWRFTNHCNMRPITAVFKNTSIGNHIALE